MKLLKIRPIRGEIEAISGIMIGGSGKNMEIGAVDNPIIRNPLTLEPYIPGSSIKGKLRSLMEWHLGLVNPEDDRRKRPYQSNQHDCPISRVFGAMGNESPANGPVRGPTRLIVRDAYLTETSREALSEMNLERGTLFTEIKQEVFIPRLGGDANPRTMERVPAGARFNFEIIYKIFDTGDAGELDKRLFRDVVLKALDLLELDALGGSSSRGYGQIKLHYQQDPRVL